MHYQRVVAHGEVGPAEPLIGRRGEGHLNRLGYREVQIHGVKRLEHQWVMERTLGRPLEKYEHVHHRNGVRSDNRPENLELWVTGHPYGQRPEDLIAFVVEHYSDAVRSAFAGR